MFPESYFNSFPKGGDKRPPKHYVKSDKSYMTMKMTVVIVAIKNENKWNILEGYRECS